MTRSGRQLNRRTARDWWTKGLLPRPATTGLGRGKGRVTFWPDNRIVGQAQAVFDLLAKHRRTETVLVWVWLIGFEVEPRVLKRAWVSLIAKSRPWVRVRNELGDQVGVMAATWARHWEGSTVIREKVEPLLHEALGVFFGTGEEITVQDLGALAMAVITAQQEGTGAHRRPTGGISDEDIAFLLELLRDYWSLAAQREAIENATEYEMVRARRLLHVFLGYFRRASSGNIDGWRAAAVTFGKPVIPLLLRLLRGPYGVRIIRVVLTLSLALRGRTAIPSAGTFCPP